MASKMWKWLDEKLNVFKGCFGNKRTYGWFVIIVFGMMIRTDHVGLTGIVRELSLTPSAYVAILHFFRSESWNLTTISMTWQRLIMKTGLIYTVNGLAVLIGDGTKEIHDGKRMPGVKKLHQESESSTKSEYIMGHMFGGVGVLIGEAGKKLFCVLLSMRLHEGINAIMGWKHDEPHDEDSHVVKIIQDAGSIANIIGASILLLDRLYLTVPMLRTLAMTPLLKVVTKAKSNATAYLDPKPRKGRGAKARKGEKVKVFEYLRSHTAEMVTTAVYAYGEVQAVSYYSADLQWGLKWYQKLRFVLVYLNGREAVLVSTDLTMTPEQIIELYCLRFKIECSFRELKQVVAGFCYRFWSKYMPKLKRYKSNEVNQEQVSAVTEANARKRIEDCVKAIHGYALFGCIALGMLQMISLSFSSMFNDNVVRFMRTKSNIAPSEATVADFIRRNIYQLFRFHPDLPLTDTIKSKQLVIDDRLYDQSTAQYDDSDIYSKSA